MTHILPIKIAFSAALLIFMSARKSNRNLIFCYGNGIISRNFQSYFYDEISGAAQLMMRRSVKISYSHGSGHTPGNWTAHSSIAAFAIMAPRIRARISSGNFFSRS